MAARYLCMLLRILPMIIVVSGFQNINKDGDVRVIGGSYPWEGRVEIYFSGSWGTITDSDWTSDDAQAVCRKLGYFKPATNLLEASGLSGAYFGSGSGPIHLDYVVCSGTEYTLTDCQTGTGTRQSSHSEDVGVKCQTSYTSYQEGSIRLVGGDYNWEGRVEIFYSGTWSSISDISWTTSDATVVCKQLRHSAEGADPRCCGYYGEGSGPISVHLVSCNGTEANITSCSYLTSTVNDHHNDVGVQCQRGEIYHEGDVRLVGGSYSWEGRVEIYLYGEWGTITDLGADVFSAHVVCQQLGYDIQYGYADVSYPDAKFGVGSGPIHMNFLDCSGTEYKLTDCGYQRSTYDHGDDWSVTCKNDNPNTGEVRLYLGSVNPSYFRGRVEVYISDEWGTVADDGSWSLEDGEVVCRQLGFKIPSKAIDLHSTSFGATAPTHMSNVQCSGNESRLTECPHSTGGNGSAVSLTCDYRSSEWHRPHIVVASYSGLYEEESCSKEQLRLVGGETEMEGRVEVCTSYNIWGAVCNKQWTPSHTRVVCRNLGYSDSEGSYQALNTFGGSVIPLVMDFVNCSGSETKLRDCLHFTHGYSECSQHAGVHCEPGTIYFFYSRSGDTFYSRSLRISQVYCDGTESRLSDCIYTPSELTGCHQQVGISCSLAGCVDGEVRLMEGEFEWEGRLEVCFGQRWGTVSSDGWTETNSHVICNDLGYDLDAEADYSPLRTATKSMPVFMSNVQCSNMDNSLLDCSYSRNSSNRDHSKDLGVKCKKFSCDDGDLRLFGGESESEGLLEVCFSQRWGTVNGDGWSSSDTQVACRQLGFEGAGDYSSYEQKGILSAPIYMDYVGCYGSEDKLIDCSYHTDTTEDHHSNDVWINCDTSEQDTTDTTEQSTDLSTPIMDTPDSEQSSDQSQTTMDTSEQNSDHSIAKTALAISVVLLVITIAAILLNIAYIILYKHKRRTYTSDSVCYQSDGNRDTTTTVDSSSNKDNFPN